MQIDRTKLDTLNAAQFYNAPQSKEGLGQQYYDTKQQDAILPLRHGTETD